MSPKFNIDRPKVSDEEIKQHQNFTELVERFKQQSLKQARGDESWWQNKKVRYSTVIAGITVVCTISYFSLFNNQHQNTKTNETLITQKSTLKPTPKAAFINAPSQKLKPAYSSYKVNNAKGGTITHTTTSKIKVPKNSFVDKNGKDIVGDVTIEYQEFHDMGDVIASGIPMAYDSAGSHFNLESAGMFDIKGTQDGEPVFIKPGKPLQIELASANAEDKFNQYYLDTLERNWKYIQRDNVLDALKRKAAEAPAMPMTSSPKLEALKNEIEKVIPKKIDSVKVLYTARAEKLPRAKEPNKPVKFTPGKPTFKLDGSYKEYPELEAFDNVIFEVGPENKNYSKELHEITWSDVKVLPGPVKGKNYILNLIYRNRSEKLIVYPVLQEADYKKAQEFYQDKFEAYENLVEKRVQQEQKLLAEMQAKQAIYLAEQKKKQEDYDKEKAAMQAKYNMAEQKDLASNFNALSLQVKATRLFQVARFGIYNSDCPHSAPSGNTMVPSFVMHDSQKTISADLIYLIDHSNKTVYALDKATNFRMTYDPQKIYSLCVFNKTRLYLCNKENFKHTSDTESKLFRVQELPGSADNLADFKKAIEL